MIEATLNLVPFPTTWRKRIIGVWSGDYLTFGYQIWTKLVEFIPLRIRSDSQKIETFGDCSSRTFESLIHFPGRDEYVRETKNSLTHFGLKCPKTSNRFGRVSSTLAHQKKNLQKSYSTIFEIALSIYDGCKAPKKFPPFLFLDLKEKNVFLEAKL